MSVNRESTYDIAKKNNIPDTYVSCMANELKSNRKSDAFYYSQLEISYLPPEIIKVLWQRNVVLRITNLFWDVFARVTATEEVSEQYCWNRFGSTAMNLWSPLDFPYKPMTWTRLYNSWLYKTMFDWACDKKIDLPNRDEIKRTLFEIAVMKESRYES